MFRAYSENDILPITEQECFQLNTFLSLNPNSWTKRFDEKWSNLFSSLRLHLDFLKIEPKIINQFRPELSLCFLLDGVEAFGFVSEETLSLALQVLGLENENKNLEKFKISTVVEYCIRKFICDVCSNWVGKNLPKVEFLGQCSYDVVDSLEFEMLDVSLGLNGVDLNFLILLPRTFLDLVSREFSANPFGDKVFGEDEESEYLSASIDLCTIEVPTNTLIDILRKDRIILLPQIMQLDSVEVKVGSVVLNGFLRKQSNRLVVKLSPDSPSERLPLNVKSTYLTVSICRQNFDKETFLETPRVLFLNQKNFSEVDLLISNETVSKGSLGVEDSQGCLAIKIS